METVTALAFGAGPELLLVHNLAASLVQNWCNAI